MSDVQIHWQDKELKFDVSQIQLKLGQGEKVFFQSELIEDTKGNPGNLGIMQITNLRCIWYQVPDSKINLSLGYDCMIQIECKVSGVKGGVLHIVNIKAKQKNSKFEFIFQTQFSDQKETFQSLKDTYDSYQQTRLYREIKARGVISENKNIIQLEMEKVISTYNKIMSLSQDNSVVLGRLFLSNVRLTWFSISNESFNISIPWICIKRLKRKDLKSGASMIIETKSSCGGYIVGYNGVDIDKIIIEAQKIHQIYIENPELGVQLTNHSQHQQVQQIQFNEDVEIIETGYNEISTSSKSYYMGGENDQLREIIFNPILGMAIEKPPDGLTIEDLWKIINIK